MSVQRPPEARDTLAVRPGKAAALLDVSRAMIYKLMNDGELPFFAVGSMRRIQLADIEAYIATHQNPKAVS